MSLRHHAHKPLFHWSRVSGLRQVAGPVLKEPREIPDRAAPQALFEFLVLKQAAFFDVGAVG